MRTVSIILLTVIYPIATTGISLEEFYCCSKLKSVTVAFVDAPKEKCYKGNHKGNCYESRYEILKVSDKHLASISPKFSYNQIEALYPFNSLLQPVLPVGQALNSINGAHSPPYHSGIPIYIFNCVFRI